MFSDLLLNDETIVWLTQDDEGEIVVGDQSSDDGSDPNGGANQPFLEVNERTKYLTAEDAKKGFLEAQSTITSLSEYRKVLEELGAPKDADASYLRGVLTEYIRLASEAEAAKAATTSKKTTSSEDDKEFEGVDPKIVAQTKRGRQWLKDNAGKVGLVSQEKFDELQAKLDKLEGGLTQRDAEERESAIAEGQEKLTQWLGEAKVELSQPERTKLENLIAAYVNSDEGLTNKWLKGDRAVKMELVKEGYSMFLPVVKPGASPFVKAKEAVSTGKTKIGLLNRTRNLPNSSGSGKETAGKKPMRIGDSSLREKARALMAKFEAEGSGE